MDLIAPKAPEEFYPLEVWELILDHLRSPVDLLNCKKVCKAWGKLLELKKTTFLMPKVFPILYKYLETLEDDKEDEEDENEEAITTILKMRLVSHGWKESVDSYFQHHPKLNDIGFKPMAEDDTIEFDFKYEPLQLIPYRFGEDEQRKCLINLESFLEKGFSPARNPFITRYVSYSDSVSSLETAFKTLLEAYGSHIWTCELFVRVHTNEANLYKRVGSYLRLMPNLRSLKLWFQGYCDNGCGRDSTKRELEWLLQNEPFPRLEHLTKLEMNDVPYPLSVGILASNGHLHKLSFQNSHITADDPLLPDNISSVQLPSLKQLTFPYCQQGLLKFTNVTWPIKVLNLKVDTAKLKNVFQAVSSTFSNSLEHFTLCHEHFKTMMENKEEMQQIKLELPKLSFFKLQIVRFELETIDFLQDCTGLQEIQLVFNKNKEDEENASSSTSTVDEDYSGSSSTDEEDNEVIQFKNCITSMNQSNIWRILNKLQFIKVKTLRQERQAYISNTIPLYPNKFRKFTRRQFEKFYNTNRLQDKFPE